MNIPSRPPLPQFEFTSIFWTRNLSANLPKMRIWHWAWGSVVVAQHVQCPTWIQIPQGRGGGGTVFVLLLTELAINHSHVFTNMLPLRPQENLQTQALAWQAAACGWEALESVCTQHQREICAHQEDKWLCAPPTCCSFNIRSTFIQRRGWRQHEELGCWLLELCCTCTPHSTKSSRPFLEDRLAAICC